MLELMRRNAGSWIIKVLLGAIAVAFALSWGVYKYGDHSQQAAVVVNGEPITRAQIHDEQTQLAERARAQLGAQFDKLLPMLNLEERAKESLVERLLLFQAARGLGIAVTDGEVAARVAGVGAFQRDGAFNRELYRRVLSMNRLTPEQFEAMQRNEIVVERLMALVAGTAQVTPLEVEEAQKDQLAQVRGVYRLFDNAAYLDKMTAKPEDLTAYYEAHQAAYAIPEKLVLAYLTFPAADYRDQAQVQEEDIQEAYETGHALYSRPERVRARHILLMLPKDAGQAEDQAAKTQAETLLAEAQKPGADFAALAREHSKDGSAENGGDLGYFTRGQVVPEFEEVAFKLKPGELATVRTTFGWHVVKVEDHQAASLTPLEKVRGEIREALVMKQARELATAQAEQAFDQVAAGTPAAEVAGQLGRALMPSEPTPPDQPVEGLPGLKGLAEVADGVGEGQVLPVMLYEAGSVLALVEKRIPASHRPLAEVEEEVRQAVLAAKAATAAREDAARLLAELKTAADPAAALKASPGAKETEWLPRDGQVPGLDPSAALVSALFARPAGQPLAAQPVAAGAGFAACALLERKEPAPEELAAKKKEFTDELLALKRREIMRRFMSDLRAKAEIKVPAS